VSDLVKAKSPEVDNEVRAKIELTMDAMGELYRRGVMVESYDQMIGEGNEVGNATVQKVVDSLLNQTKEIERAVASLDLKSIKFEGSDSLDEPNKVMEENKSAGVAAPASAQ
jgi:putative iron-regulated protein